MTVDFNDYFWGEKNNGFDVLYHNMKFGLVASKELSEFLREKTNIEEQNSKMMSKLAHKASTATLNSTFAPIWTILRTSAEKISTLHMQMVQKLTELVKDVAKYADELHKKHRTVKDEESQTLECVQAIQTSTAAVQKSRDLYANKVLELEKLKKENGSQKDIEKLETKLKKLQEEYKALLDKHNPIKNEFERRMTQTCKRFQEIEEIHLRQMKEFLSTYLEMLQNNHDMVGQVHSDFKRQFLDMTVDKLLEQFVLNKYTGLEKPDIPELEFIPLSIDQNKSQSTSRLNQPAGTTASISSNATNSNSATSIPATALAAKSGGVSMDHRGSDISGLATGSLGSGGSNSLINADDSILGIPSQPSAAPANRPISPEPSFVSSPGLTGTTTTPAAATSTTSVKSNFRNWFSSSKQQQNQQQQQTQQQLQQQQHGQQSSSPPPQPPSPQQSILLPQQQSQAQENQAQPQDSHTTYSNINNQGSFFTPTLTQLSDQFNLNDANNGSSSFPSKLPSNSSASQSKDSSHHANPKNHLINFFNNNPLTSINSNSSDKNEIKNASNNSNIFASSALNTSASSSSSLMPISGILRSRRDKTKTKKAKKKKDGESTENIQEERMASSELGNDTLVDFEERHKIKTQNSSGSSAGGGNLTIASAPGNIDSGGILSSSLGKNGSAIGNADDSKNGLFNSTTKGSNNANVSSGSNGVNAGGYGSLEVDEDGYSMQPNKEIAWEENNDNAGSFSSDSDTDSETEKRDRRIHVNIKPLNNGQAPMSASVDELRATVENISLSPTGVFSHSQQLQQTRAPSRQQSPEISNASTPTASVHPYAPLQSPTLSMTTNSRYADLGDIFSELGDVSSSAPASASFTKPNRQIPTPTSSIAIPRPPSRRSEMISAATVASSSATGSNVAAARGRVSPSAMNRAESINSLEFRNIGSSRGPSPLTIGITDTIPLAVAFHEAIHACFKGSDESRCKVKIAGDLMLSFPAGIIGLLANNPNPAKLSFRLKNIQNIEHLLPNNKLVQIDKSQSNSFGTVLDFNMPVLTTLLRRQAEHNPAASYFNVDILKYQARTKPGASSCPFQLVSYWKCEPTFTALKIDYKYNSHAMATASPLLNVTISVPVNGSVRNVQSKPHSAWLGESNRLVWNFTDISQNSTDAGVGTLRARLELNDGPSTPALLTTQFNCEGTTLSGLEFELQGSGYRLSLVKRRFVAGQYTCEGDGIRSGATPTPPSVGSSSPYSAKSN